MVDALVLSGGASHGDFEVGAVRRLFEAGFQPALIVSASVGSINAVKLCEMGALATAGAPSGLEQIWLSRGKNSDMYTLNPDFDTSALNRPDIINQLQNIGLNLQADYTWRLLDRAAAGMVAGGITGAPLGILGAAGGSAAGLAVGLLTSILQSGNDLTALINIAQPLIQALQQLEKAQSHYTLDPISKVLFEDIDPAAVKNSSIRLLMAVVSLESGDLRYITGNGNVMKEDTTTPYSETVSVNQLCQDKLDDYNSALDDLRGVGGPSDYTTYADYQRALLKAQAEVAKAKAALDACQRDHPGPVVQPVSTDVRTGVLASAAIPMIFKPVKIGNDNYVDGGTRNQVPINGAIAAGATKIWAIDCNHPRIGLAMDPLSGQPIGSFDSANFLQIGGRAAGDILPYQLQLDNDAAVDTRSATVTLVQPEFDIHNGFTIDPGLILIRMAHGYMRTDDIMFAEVVYGDTALNSLNAISMTLHTIDIISQRYQIWFYEHAAVNWGVTQDPDETINAPIAPATPTVNFRALISVRQMKRQLRQLMTARVNGVNLDGSPITLNGKQLNSLFGPASPGGRIPEQPIPSDTWWMQWEAHQLSSPDSGSVAFSAVAPSLWGAASNQVNQNLDGRLEVFAVGTDNALWHNWQTTPGGAWQGWTSLGSGIKRFPQAAVNADGRLEVFAWGTDNALWHNWQTTPGGGWQGWTSLGGGITRDPQAGINLDGRLEVFAVGTDNALWHNWQTTPGGGWQGWTSLGGAFTSDSESGFNADGRLEVFARGTDNALWHNWQTTPGGGWQGWSSLGGAITSGPTVAVNADGRLEVFAVSTDNALWHNWQTTPGGGWQGWTSLGLMSNNPSVAVNSDSVVGFNADGRLEVFARGTDNALWHNWQTTPGGGWQGWASLGGAITGDLLLGANADGRLEVFAWGTDNALWHNWQTTPGGGTWQGWTSLGQIP